MSLKNSPALTFFVLLSFSLFSLQAQQNPFFNRVSKSKTKVKPVINARVTGTDSIGFGGEPGVVWERLVGEVFPEHSSSIYVDGLEKLSDGNFVFCASFATGIAGNEFRSLIAKITTQGQLLWKKELGFQNMNLLSPIYPTTDGGVITFGTISQLDSAFNFNTTVVKLTSTGAIEWQQVLTSSINNWYETISASNDGGYIVTGQAVVSFTDSCLGNIQYDSTYSILTKLNNQGQFQWTKKNFITVSSDPGFFQKITRVSSGYLLMSSYLVKQKIGSCFSSEKGEQALLIKFDNNGNLQWKKEYGGKRNDLVLHMRLLPDSTLLLLGSTNSTDGDMSGIHSDSLKNVAWKLILNDTGKIISNQVYGLGKAKYPFFIGSCVNSDSSYLLLGLEDVFDSTGNQELYDSHIIKIGKNTVEEWRALYPNKYITFIEQSNINNWMFAGSLGNFETDIFGRLGTTSNITGSVYYDLNKNNTKDANEPYANRHLVTSEKNNYSRSSVAQNGWFRNDVDTGIYKTTVKLNNDYYLSVPAERQTTFTSLFQNDTVHFAMQPVAGKRDLSINLLPLTPARPGFNASYKLIFRNNGTDTITNGAAVVLKDSRTTIVSTVPATTVVRGDSLVWLFGAFKPFDEYTINIELKTAAPPTLNNGDTLRYVAAIIPSTGIGTDLTPLDDTARLAQVVVGSYDPNDKQENVAGKIPLAKITSGEDIQYLIRFQNTGTDTAFTVQITDTLDAKLNWNSFQMIAASHPYKITVKDGNKITWTFSNINLPDSNRNSLLSNGFISFKIKAKTSLAAGDYFQNKASIYFDYNLPVITNTATTVVSTAVITAVRLVVNTDMQLLAMPNPSGGDLYIKLSGKLNGKFEYTVVDMFGRVLQQKALERSSSSDVQLIPLRLNNLSKGVYFIIVRQKEKQWKQQIIIQ
ncbi:T9SS type A sorting domain-containing protein [Lacibacter luteus]|uniref:T9SS type A sorting domain-containing protein n=1 Tax=Lacibacter luteus TaxID=2508719 RepID=A0A4Q1CEH6_9BACT|nr:T9SS type A sorting domain-containing protein [Lacibacter luteus]RXK57836.1 T9SS type A sorting domain-containing protein [Lacibacter luteus]